MLGLVVVWWVDKTNAKVYQISKLTTNSAVKVDSMLMPSHKNNENKSKSNQKVVIKVWMDLKVQKSLMLSTKLNMNILYSVN